MLLIRNIHKSDYEAIDRLLLQLHHVDVAGRPELFMDIEHFMTKEAFNSLIENPDMILAEQRGRILGCCFVSMMERSGMVSMKTAYIDLLVVDEPYRRSGIGQTLFQSVQKRARKMGAKRIDLMVWSHNQTAIDAYESYGMKPQRCVYEKLLD